MKKSKNVREEFVKIIEAKDGSKLNENHRAFLDSLTLIELQALAIQDDIGIDEIDFDI